MAKHKEMYRGWSNQLERWIYGTYLHEHDAWISEQFRVDNSQVSHRVRYIRINVDPKSVSRRIQTAEVGTELFEGDIVEAKLPATWGEESKTIIGVIEYNEYSASYRIYIYQNKEAYLKNEVWDEYPIHQDIKINVIGNIYHDLELLDKE